MTQTPHLSPSEIAMLVNRQSKVAGLKGKNPEPAFFDDWSEQEVNDALEYGDLTRGCRKALEQKQTVQQAWKQPSALSAANSTKMFKLGLAGLTATVLGIVLTLSFHFHWF